MSAHKHVESTEFVKRGLDHSLGGVHVGDVADEGDGFAARVTDFCNDRSNL